MSLHSLTHRQREIVLLLWNGERVPIVAGLLGIALTTARSHVRDIRRVVLQRYPADAELPAVRLIRKHAPDLLAA